VSRTYKKLNNLPRLPLEGSIDLTYRCNSHCRHCWLWTSEQVAVQKVELTLEEIRRIAGEARAMGCRYWNISGGEPLLRHDFAEIFDYLTGKAIGYTLNTNGTLISPQIARLLKRNGVKLISLYGATAQVYDHVTGHPGGFEQLMQGFAYLKEAGAGFTVQLVPMRDNWHQWDKMVALARSLSPFYRVGAPWLYLSSDGLPSRNREIAAQRLSPSQVIELDPPNPYYKGNDAHNLDPGDDPGKGLIGEDASVAPLAKPVCGELSAGDDRLFARCIEARRDFHIDPYGQMTWCSYIKDPALRYDLRCGSFQEAWETFIPSCADKVRGGEEWRNNCGSCAKRGNCRCCAVHAFLETGRYSAPVPYLCAVADEAARFKNNWREKHRRHFQIAGITVCLESDLNLDAVTFKDEISAFAVDSPGKDIVTLRHHFEMPDLEGKDLGQVLYRKLPWVISYKDGTWFYKCISDDRADTKINRLAVFNDNYTRGIIYSHRHDWKYIIKYGWQSLSLFPTDQIWLGPLLADRQAMLLHSAAAIVNGRGLIFVGRSDAGKSTTMELLKSARFDNGLQAEILCDDRNVVRKWSDGWRVHGTWSHGDIADVSLSSARLQGVLFLEQAAVNSIDLLADRKNIWRRLLATIIRPMVTAQWWQKELDMIEQLVNEVPCYTMRFDKSGAIIPELERLTR
jgi:MoaA/NifB/PqqE/SkfB family radical SAM enzyme